MAKAMYSESDSFRKKLKANIRKEFNRIGTLAFDELNVLRITSEVKSLYQRLLDFNKSGYKNIARSGITYALSHLTEKEAKLARKKMGKHPEDSYIDYVLSSYDYVTGYKYKTEADRKRLRFQEEVLTAREYHDRERYRYAVNKSANLWFTQSGQYALNIEDESVKRTWIAGGIRKVRWVSEDDSRVCSDCKRLNGKIFSIDSVPPKQHYNCRCTLVPVREDTKTQ